MSSRAERGTCFRSFLPSELADDRQRFGDRCVAVAGADRVLDATVQMMLEKLSRERIERRLHGGNLREDIDAIAIVFEHLPNSAHLSFDTAKAPSELRLAGRVT